MTVHDYVRILRSHWLAIALLMMIGAVSAWGWTTTQTRVYEANSSGIITLASDNTMGSALASDTLAKSKATTYVGIGESRAVAQLVITELGLSTTPEALVGSITVANVKDTPTLNVTARAASGERAKMLADAWITGMAKQIAIIETQTIDESAAAGTAAGGSAAGVGAVGVTAGTTGGAISADGTSIAPITYLVPVESAIVATQPVSPNVKLSVILGALVGAILGLLYAMIRNVFDQRIRRAAEIEDKFGQSVIGKLPFDKRLKNLTRLIPEQDLIDLTTSSRNDFMLAEAFRQLRTNLRYMHVDSPPRLIVVTSPSANDGKSTVAANLAVALAASGQRVVVVDGDLRKPAVANAFGLADHVGVTDVLIGNAQVEDLLQEWGTDGMLAVLGAGSIPPNPSELLGTHGMESLLRGLAKNAIVLVDAPPLLPVTDAAILANIADGAIIVVSSGRTTTEELESALATMAKSNGQVLGVVLNRVPSSSVGRSAYGYYYGSPSTDGPKKNRLFPQNRSQLPPVDADQSQNVALTKVS